MFSKILLVICVFSSRTLQAVCANDTCRSPSGSIGSCVNIKSCESLKTILITRPIPANSLRYLLQSQCGFEGIEPKVCCPFGNVRPPDSNVTPSSTPTNPSFDNDDISQTTYYSEPPTSISGHRNLALLPSDCGELENDRLYGGNKTGIFEFPWMALLAYNTSRGTKFQCGGTIINPRYILTAAHCLTGLVRKTLIGVRVGEHNLATEEDCEESIPKKICAPKYQDIGVEEMAVHPQYIGGRGTNARYQNDVGVIRLNTDIDVTTGNALPICLPVTKKLQEYKTDRLVMTVTGWGTKEDGFSSLELLKISIPIVENLQCGTIINGSIRDGVGFRQMCAGGVLGVDACSGDSGGPILYPEKLNNIVRYIQFGIVSFGSAQSCGRAGVPGVYTRVAYYMDWILNNMKS